MIKPKRKKVLHDDSQDGEPDQTAETKADNKGFKLTEDVNPCMYRRNSVRHKERSIISPHFGIVDSPTEPTQTLQSNTAKELKQTVEIESKSIGFI